MSLVLEDFHGFRGLLLRARAPDSRFALSSPEPHQGLRRRGKDMCASRHGSAALSVRGDGHQQTGRESLCSRRWRQTKHVYKWVTLVVMEATGDYWKPSYYLLDPVLNVILVSPRHARNLPGRKTDVSDAQGLVELGTVSSGPPSCRPNISVNYVTSPGPEPSSSPREAERFNASRNCSKMPTSKSHRSPHAHSPGHA